MKIQFTPKLGLVFSLLLVGIYTVIYACGPSFETDFDEDTNFTPNAFVDESYSPLFLSIYNTFGDDYNSRFNDEIIADWSGFLKEKMKPETIGYFLTSDSSKTDFQQISQYYKNKKATNSTKKWYSEIDFKNDNVKGFFSFLTDAKKVENASVSKNRWDYSPDTLAVKEMIDTWNAAYFEKKYNSQKNEFLKNRYWFQTCKAAFYSGDAVFLDKFFSKTEKATPKNTLYYRAMSYVAGFKNKYEANYMYSQVFENCKTMRMTAAQNFRIISDQSIDSTLVYAKNNQEKTSIWAIQGFYGDENLAMNNIFELDPKSEHLEYLATRIINFTESKTKENSSSFDWYSMMPNKTKDSVQYDENYNQIRKSVEEQQKINQSLIAKNLQLFTKIGASNQTLHPYFWKIAKGYMLSLQGNYKQAEENYKLAENDIPTTDLAKNQLRLLRFINNLGATENLNTNSQQKLLADAKWLFLELPKNNPGSLRYTNALSWSRVKFSDLYKKQNNWVLAEISLHDAKFYLDAKSVADLKATITNQNNSDLEQVLCATYPFSLADINQYQAVLATYQDKISDAVGFMKQTDNIQHGIFYGNPFNGYIKDCHDCEHLAYQKKKYSYIDFLETMKTMQDKITKKEDVYTNSILVANGFYNITEFGNARLFYDTPIIIDYGFYPYYSSGKERFNSIILDCSKARKYYTLALQNAKTDEQKAKCYYMLAKCERNDFYTNRTEYNGIDFLAFDGFKKLKYQYNKTKFYQEVLAECGYFETYVNN